MRIIFLSQRVPYPPDRGDRIRSYNIVRFLSQRYEVSVAALARSKEEADEARQLKDVVRTVDVDVLTQRQSLMQYPSALARGLPLTLAHYRSDRLAKRINEQLSEYDLAFVYCSSMAPFVDSLPILKVIDFVDCDSAKWDDYAARSSLGKRWVYRREASLLRNYETDIIAKFDHCFVTTEQERDLLANHATNQKITVAASGIDFANFSRQSMAEPPEPHTLVFTGVMDYFANIDGVTYFVDHTLPVIRKVVPDVKFLIVGRNPTREISALSKNPSVIVTGYVSDVRPYLERSAVSVVPLRIARGTQNKILEAMAMELPVVATSAAAKGIRAVADEHLKIADTPGDFANAVVQLMKDTDRRNAMARKARQWVETHCDWNVTLKGIEDVIDLIGDRTCK